MAIPKLVRRVGIALAILAGVALLLLGIVHLPPVRARVLDYAHDYAARELGIALDAKSLDYNLLRPSAELHGVVIASMDDKDRRLPLLYADGIRIVLGRGLFLGQVDVSSLELVRPRLVIVRRADGTLNLPRGRGEASKEVTPLHLGRVDIRGLLVSVDDEITGQKLNLGAIDLSIDTSSPTSVPGAFGPSPFGVSFRSPGSPGPVTTKSPGGLSTLKGTIAGRLGFDGTRLLVPALTIETPEGRLALDGSIEVISPAPRVDVRARARVDLARAAHLAGLDGEGLSGTLDATGEAKGLMSAPAVRLGLDGSGLAVRSLRDVTLTGDATLANGRLNVAALDLRSPLGVAHAQGDVALAAGGAPSRLDARWSDVDLDAAIGTAGHALPTRIGSSASGTAALRLTGVPGPSSLSGLDADVSSTLRPSGGGLALAGTLDANVRDGAWTLAHRLTSAPASTSLGGTVRGRLDAATHESTLDGGTRLRVDDLHAAAVFARGAGVALPESIAASLGGTLAGDVQLRGTIARPSVQATLAARDVRASGVAGGTVDAAVAATRDALRIESLAVQLGRTRLHAAGSYAWNGRADVRFDAQAADLAALARTFELSSPPVAGSAHVTGRAWGTVEAPQADGTLEAQQLSVDGVDVGRLGATFALAGNTLHAEASAPALAVSARGDVDTRAPYAYQAQVQLDRARIPALVPASLREQVPVSEGTITGTLRASGTARQPMPDTADAKLDALDAVVNGTHVVLESPATLAWTPSRIAVGGLGLRVGRDAHARVSGSLGDAPTADPLRITADSPLTELIALAGPLLADHHVAADGSLALDLGIGGTLRAPQPNGTLSVRAASVKYGDLPAATGVVVDALVDPALIVLRSAGAVWQQATLAANGTVPLRLIARALVDRAGNGAADGWAAQWLASLPREPERASLSARVTGVTPRALAPFVSAEQLREIDGTAALTVTADADAPTLAGVRATAVLDEASLTLAGVPFRQVVPTRLRLDNGQLRIEDLRWDSLGNPLVVTGGADLAAARPTVDARVAGVLDLRVAGAFASGIAASGTARGDVTIGGLLESPEIAGEVTVADGELRVDSPRLIVSDLAGSIRIAKDRAAVVGLKGTLNGGAAEVAGNLNLTTLADPRGAITLTATDVAFEFPDGLQTESNVRLSLALAETPALSGRIDVLGGTYREPIVLTSTLLEGLLQRGAVTAAASPDFLSRLRLDLTLAATDGILVDNNYGRLEIAGTLRIAGTPDRPEVLGRLEAAPDGELYLAGNTYRVEQLVLDFSNPRALTPDVSFLAQTRIGNSAIEVDLQCAAPAPCERKVTASAGDLTDAEAEALLFGVPADATAAGEQLARLLSGEVLGLVSRRVKLDTLRLEQGTRGRSDIFDDPTLVAGDVDPASRLTLGKRLGDRVELAYSQSLTDSGFTWSTTYRAPYGLSFRALLLDDQSRSYEFRHEPRFGESRESRASRPPGPRVVDVRIGGTPGFPEPEVRRRLKLTRGDRFQFAAWQDDRDRLEELYRSRGFHEARIRARRQPAPAEGGENGVLLEYLIDRGPETRLDVRGVELPEDVRARILDRWSSAMFDAFLERDAKTIVRDHLARGGHLDAKIDTAVHVATDRGAKTLAVTVDPGPVVPTRLEFTGNAGLPTERLDEAARAIGTLTAWLDPPAFARAIQAVYRDEGYLAAQVDMAPPEVRGGTSVVTVCVHEESAFEIGKVAVEGGGALPDTDLFDALALSSGMLYRAAEIPEAMARVDARHRQAGYLSSRTTVDAVVRQEAARVDLRLTVTPGPRSVLREIVVDGADPQKPLVARAIVLTPGAPIDPAAIGTTRKQLYDSGVYRGVEIELQPVGDAAGDTQLVDARIKLLERPRYRLRYGLAYNDEVVATDVREQQVGAAADFERRNVFGAGGTAGVSARLRQDQQIGRVFLGANRFFGAPLRSTMFLERSRNKMNSEGTFPIVASVTDFSVEQAYSIRRRVEIRYGYALGQNRTFIEDQDFDVSVRAARLTGSGLVDRRDDPFNPTRGWFASSNLELSRPGLGSDLSFLKGFLQYYHFVPVRGMVLASAARMGLARTYDDQDLLTSERFFAGGANSVRGYRQDDLGPRSILDDAAGGSALLVFNEELRFPVYRWLRGVGFVDLGNVYDKVGDISLGDLQVGVGAGVRLDTPVGLFRVDLGVPANPRSFDPKWKIYFGLGHAF